MRPKDCAKYDLRGLSQRDRNPATVLTFGAEYGHLTALRQSAGDKRYTVFRCRCGEQVIRMSSDVSESIKLGRTPMCKVCRAKERRAAAERERRAG